MKLEALDHPKTLDLAARLEVELPTAIGHLELLWAFTGKKAPQGNIGKWPDGAIARACYWMGRPEVFLLALQESGFLEVDDQHRFTVHDWREHAPGWVRAKLKKVGLTFIATRPSTSDDSSDCSLAQSLERSSEPSIQGKGSTSEVKGSKGADAPDDVSRGTNNPIELLAGVNADAWNRWLDYRKQIRKPLKPVSLPAAQRELAAFGADQAAVVEQSIAQGWQGLFALKGDSKTQARLASNISAAQEFLRRTDAA